MIRDSVQDFEAAEEAESCVAVILGALITAAVFPVLIQKVVDASGCPAENPGLCLTRERPGEGGEQHVLSAPDRPVVHVALSIAHPPEVLFEIGGKDPRLQFVADHDREEGAYFV